MRDMISRERGGASERGEAERDDDGGDDWQEGRSVDVEQTMRMRHTLVSCVAST